MSERISQNGSFYNGVTIRLFPLLADPSTLQDFVDRFINHEQLLSEHYFRAANSMVYLQVLSYQKLSPRQSRYGYISQNEVIFSIPLLWYRKSSSGNNMYNGHRYELVKHEDCSMAPYIMVDSEQSVLGGRELYGWPKQLMDISDSSQTLVQHPLEDESLLKMNVHLYEELYNFKKPRSTKLLEIRRKQHSRRDGQRDVGELLAHAAKKPIELQLSVGELMKHKKLHDDYWYKEIGRQYGPDESGAHAHRAGLMFKEIAEYELWQKTSLLGRKTNNIGLKQSYLSDRPAGACYQALGNSVSRIEHVRGFGPLGAESRGVSRGYEVSLWSNDQISIGESLGLIPYKRYDGFSKYLPVSPSWLDLDLSYALAEEDPFLVQVHGAWVKQDRNDLPVVANEYTIGMGAV